MEESTRIFDIVIYMETNEYKFQHVQVITRIKICSSFLKWAGKYLIFYDMYGLGRLLMV